MSLLDKGLRVRLSDAKLVNEGNEFVDVSTTVVVIA